MLTCEQATEKASARLDGQLDSRERLALAVHLLICNRCRRFARQLAGLVAALRKRELVEPVDQEFVDRVVDRLDEVSPPQRPP